MLTSVLKLMYVLSGHLQTQYTVRHNTLMPYNNVHVVSLRMFFKVCKSVHHRTIQINHHPDATIFQFIILTFIYSSTCFGRFPAHHQELNDCSGSLWFYLRIVVVVVPDHEHHTTFTTIRG